MTKNTLKDLNDHLFMQLERLSDEGMTESQLKAEIKRSQQIANVAGKVIDNGKLVLDAQKFRDNMMDKDGKVPRMLEG